MDETTNAIGQYIANLIVGKLCEDINNETALTVFQEVTNYATISRFVNSTLRILLSNSGEERILLFITDAAPYMMKAGKNLKLFYENIVHVTCIVHDLHRIAKEIRIHFPLVNKLVMYKKDFY